MTSLKEKMIRASQADKYEVLAAVDEAFASRNKAGFQAWCKDTLGTTVYGTKGTMLQQMKDMVNGLAVTRVQCSF